ncbi:unnamed protein product [Calypogeia fissa]
MVSLPPGARLIPSKWVYSHKPTSGIYKARFVARGDKQRPGEDFTDTFASVVRPETFWALMALITSSDLEAKSFDIVTTFLYALMKGQPPIYVKPPPGYEEYDSEGRLLVLLLLKALYGLRQSPRLWYQEIIAYLASFDFLPLPFDPCVLRHTHGDVLILWVNDIITISSMLLGIDHMEGVLQSKYEVRQMGELTEYLGLSINRDRKQGLVFLAQGVYTRKILTQSHLDNCISLSAPSTGSDNLTPSPTDAKPDDRHLFQAMVGSLMYLTVWTRPDIAERCAHLGQFAHNPAQEHHSSIRNVFAYVKGTPDLALRYQQEPNLGLEVHSLNFIGYSHASYADNVEDRKSTSGYLFKFGGGAISWKSHKQPIIATSLTEAESVTYSIACKEAIWLRALLQELHVQTPNIQMVTILYGDNKPALALTVNPEHHKKTKHIEVQWHYVREQVHRGVVTLKYLSTDDMPADGLTKPLTGICFTRFVKLLGMETAPSPVTTTLGVA